MNNLKIKYYDEEIDVFNEVLMVENITFTATLSKIPSLNRKIFIKHGYTDLTEVETEPNVNEFKVDRNTGVILFNSGMAGERVIVDYSAIGKFCVSADNVSTNIDSNGNVIETLEGFMQKNKEIIDSVNTIGDGATVLNQLEAHIESAKNLTGNIIEGGTLNDKLVKTINNSKNADTNLKESINSANTKITEMDQWVSKHGDIVNLDNRVDVVETSIPKINEQLETNTNNINSISINAKYPPLGLLPLLSDGSTDNKDRLQDMIDFLSNRGGGKIILPIGTFLISSFKLADRIEIEGLGRYSVLKSIANNTELSIAGLKTEKVIYTTLRNFSIDGNKSNQSNTIDGININNLSATNDAHHLIENMYIHDMSGNGINFSGQSRENRIINTHIETSNLSGLRMSATDNFIVNCTSNNNGLYGYDLDISYSNKLNTCKAFANTKSGFRFNKSNNIQCSNLESQENGEHGYELDSCNSFIGSSLVSDCNSVSKAVAYDGFNIKNCKYTNVQGIVSNNMLQGNGHNYAVKLLGYNTQSSINLTGYSNVRPLKPYYEENKSISNTILVNGINYSLLNSESNNIYSDENSDGISDIFNENYKHPSAITCDFSISKENSSQRLNISASTNAAEWAYIGAIKKLTLSEGKNISLFASVNRVGENINHKLSIEYYNESNVKISEEKGYNEFNIELKGKVPTNTSYVKLVVSLYPTVAGGNGYLDIFNFSYGVY